MKQLINDEIKNSIREFCGNKKYGDFTNKEVKVFFKKTFQSLAMKKQLLSNAEYNLLAIDYPGMKELLNKEEDLDIGKVWNLKARLVACEVRSSIKRDLVGQVKDVYEWTRIFNYKQIHKLKFESA
jgi:hypothetical protein